MLVTKIHNSATNHQTVTRADLDVPGQKLLGVLAQVGDYKSQLDQCGKAHVHDEQSKQDLINQLDACAQKAKATADALNAQCRACAKPNS